MKFNFLTHISMTNNLIKTLAVATALATSPTSADTPNFNSATTVTVSGESIDFKSKIASIDKEIAITQTKIDLLLQKGNLSEEDQLRYLTLDSEIEKLTAEKLVIKQSEGQQLDKKVAIIDDRIDTKREADKNILTQLSIADHKLAALDRVSKILSKNKSQ